MHFHNGSLWVLSGRVVGILHSRRFRWAGVSLALSVVGLLSFVLPAFAAPDFTFTLSPSSQTLQPGGSVSYAVGVGSVDGFTNPVTLSATGLPSGVTASWSKNPVTPPETSILTLSADSNVPTGTFSFGVQGTSGAITRLANGQATVAIGLFPICYGSLSGTVFDQSNTKLTGATVFFNGSQFSTGADGTYHFDHIQLGENNGAVQLGVVAQDDPPSGISIGSYWSQSKEPVLAGCDQNVIQDFHLTEVIPAIVSGRIVEGTPDPNDYSHVIPTSTPIDAANPFIFNHVSGQSGPDGSYQLTFATADQNATLTDQTLIVDSPDLPPRHGYWRNSADLGDIAAGQHIVQDVALVKQCTASISGHVIYADTQADAAGVNVGAFNGAHTDFIDFGAVTTDANGNYTIPEILLGHNNEPTLVSVEAVKSGYNDSGLETSPTPIGCSDNFSAPTIELAPQAGPTFGAITGRVTDVDTGAGIPNTTVGIFNCSEFPAYDNDCADVTDANGFYTLRKVLVGSEGGPSTVTLSMSAEASGYFDYFHNNDGTTTVTSGATTQKNFQLLKQQFGEVAGTVRDQITHQVLANAEVGGGVTFGGCVGPEALTDNAGHYHVGGIPLDYPNVPTSVTLCFTAAGHWYTLGTATVHTGAAAQLDADLLPVCAGGTIHGTVYNIKTGDPIAGAFINLNGGLGQATTNANGEFTLTDVPVGYGNAPNDVTVTASAPDFNSNTVTVTVFCGASITLDYGITHVGAVEGYVTNSTTGNPIANSPVFGEWGKSTTTDEHGYYKFVNVPVTVDGQARTWHVTASPEGFDPQTKNVIVEPGKTARLDFQFGAVAPGHIIVKEQTIPANDPASFSYGGDVTGSIHNGQTLSVDVAPGTYHTIQQLPAGWDLQSISCDATGSSGNTQTKTATMTIASGQTVTCTFKNVKRGSVIVRERTQPLGAAGSFTYTGNVIGTISDGGLITVSNLSAIGAPTYTATQADPTPGFDLTAVSCNDASSAHPSSGSTLTRSAQFRLDPGETVTCTFTDIKRGTLTIRKTLNGASLAGLAVPQTFSFQLRSGASATATGTLVGSVNATTANGGVVSFQTKLVANAAYQVCETVMPGWNTNLASPFVLYDPGGSNSTVCTATSVTPGQARTLAVDNRPPPGGRPLTIGFWKNWASCASSSKNKKPVLDRTMAAAEPAGITIGTLVMHGSASRPDVAPDCLNAVRLLKTCRPS